VFSLRSASAGSQRANLLFKLIKTHQDHV
jgi:hypothetical protein